MARLTEIHVIEHGCKQCDFYQGVSMWCMRFSCIENQPGGIKSARAYQRELRAKKAPRPAAEATVSPEEHQRRLDLYNQRLSDAKIAAAVGLSTAGIQKWRNAHNLPSISRRRNKVDASDEDMRQKAYRTFSSDRKAAAFCGISQTAFKRWRQARDLPAKHGKDD